MRYTIAQSRRGGKVYWLARTKGVKDPTKKGVFARADTKEELEALLKSDTVPDNLERVEVKPPKPTQSRKRRAKK